MAELRFLRTIRGYNTTDIIMAADGGVPLRGVGVGNNSCGSTVGSVSDSGGYWVLLTSSNYNVDERRKRGRS